MICFSGGMGLETDLFSSLSTIQYMVIFSLSKPVLWKNCKKVLFLFYIYPERASEIKLSLKFDCFACIFQKYILQEKLLL